MQLTTLCIVVFICHVTMTSARATREDDSDEISNYGIPSGSEEQDDFLPQENRDFEDEVEPNQQEVDVGHSLQKRSTENDLPKSDSETADAVDDDCNRGSPGRNGRDGRDGRDGAVGDAGPKGEPGLPGAVGSVGPEGPAGSSGAPGSPGPQGPHGAAGPPGVPGQPAPNPGTGSSTYIRWGRTVCPSTASLVYAGLAAGGHYTHTGSSSTHLCLPETPEYDTYRPGTQGYSVLYSVEYETSGFSPFNSLHNHDAPCAVCKVGNRGAVRMIPAIMTCPQGWTKEYHGYLMGEYISHKRGAEPICVDRNPEVVPGTTLDQNGALLYPIEVLCDGDGNLPCSPYNQEKELTCVVCSS